MLQQILQQMLQDILAAYDELIQAGEVLTEDVEQALADYINMITGLLEQQAQTAPPTTPPIGAGDIESSMPSSNVEGFAYDDKSGKLYVRFLGKHPNRNGPVYSYDNVPQPMFDLFRRGAVPARTNGQNKWGKWWKGKVPSMGASVYTLLRQGGFNYRRVG